MGQLRSGNKADLVKCLTDGCDLTVEQACRADAIILDGAVIIQMHQPKAVSTFGEYFDRIFVPYILRQLEDVNRIDIVWDIYKDDSLKRAARERRGSGNDNYLPNNVIRRMFLDRNCDCFKVREEKFYRPLKFHRTGKSFLELTATKTSFSSFSLIRSVFLKS